MPASDRESARAPEAEAPEGRQVAGTAVPAAPAAQLAAQIGNRAFSALVARWPDDDVDGLGRPVIGEADGLLMYGGGMGELGVARGQVQLLASLFHPDGPNDIAPPGYNALDPAAGLPASPLEPRPAATGFRREPAP